MVSTCLKSYAINQQWIVRTGRITPPLSCVDGTFVSRGQSVAELAGTFLCYRYRQCHKRPLFMDRPSPESTFQIGSSQIICGPILCPPAATVAAVAAAGAGVIRRRLSSPFWSSCVKSSGRAAGAGRATLPPPTHVLGRWRFGTAPG